MGEAEHSTDQLNSSVNVMKSVWEVTCLRKIEIEFATSEYMRLRITLLYQNTGVLKAFSPQEYVCFQQGQFCRKKVLEPHKFWMWLEMI